MNPVAINGASDRLIDEADQLISYIERGSNMLKFSPRKRPERKTLMVRRESHQVIWYKSGAPQRHAFEGALDIREIKEVRVGKNTKDFERWFEEIKRIENSKCFTIFYGNEFKLRSVSFA
ncbi:jg19223, partial [Pararge aegeria aegeria]